jgi:predicted nucleotidyltransferase
MVAFGSRSAPAGFPCEGTSAKPKVAGSTPVGIDPWRDYDWFMQVVDETLIAEAGRRLAAAAPDSQVILFGSHARGEANPDSDVDFLVVEPEVDNEAEESVRLHRTLRDLRVPADVIVVSREYADRWRAVRGGVVHAAFSQGRVLAG